MANARILIVDDDPFLRELYVDLLKNAGYTVSEASDGETGLKKIQEGGWDLILLDILLPKIDGLKIAKKLKEDPPVKPNKKTVFITNVDHQDELSEAKSLSDGCIIKSSLTPEEFLERVRTYL